MPIAYQLFVDRTGRWQFRTYSSPGTAAPHPLFRGQYKEKDIGEGTITFSLHQRGWREPLSVYLSLHGIEVHRCTAFTNDSDRKEIVAIFTDKEGVAFSAAQDFFAIQQERRVAPVEGIAILVHAELHRHLERSKPRKGKRS